MSFFPKVVQSVLQKRHVSPAAVDALFLESKASERIAREEANKFRWDWKLAMATLLGLYTYTLYSYLEGVRARRLRAMDLLVIKEKEKEHKDEEKYLSIADKVAKGEMDKDAMPPYYRKLVERQLEAARLAQREKDEAEQRRKAEEQAKKAEVELFKQQIASLASTLTELQASMNKGQSQGPPVHIDQPVVEKHLGQPEQQAIEKQPVQTDGRIS